MYEADVFYMSTMQQIHQQREKQQQQEKMTDWYDVIRPWEAWERERYVYPHPITVVTQVLLRNIGLLKYYKEARSLKGHYGILVQLIHWWDVHRHDFHVGPNKWYHPIEEHIYFITGLSRRGKYFPQFLDVPIGYALGSQLEYSQRYIIH